MTNCNTNVPQSTQLTFVHPWDIAVSQLENTTTYESQSHLKPNKETHGLRFTDSNRTGDYYEHMVIMAAWEKGVEVFKNAGCTGKIDLVLAKSTNDLLSIDVGVAQSNKTGHLVACGSFSKKTATPVLVHPITKQIRWVRGREPKGWEDFWE